MPTQHTLEASPSTVHWGYFDAALAPVLRVKSGDRVTINSVSGTHDELPPAPFTVLPAHREILATHKPRLGAHILTGPIAVEGAEPGDTLEIRIHDVQPSTDWGYNTIRPLAGTLPEDFPILRRLNIPIDRQRMVGILPWGTEIPLRPFFGVMGVAPPPVYGAVTSIIPREYGGNMDLKELSAGSTLYLPVFCEGALLSIGDGHSVQGDGEVCLTALETCMHGTVELILRKDLHVKFPRAETPTHHITIGLDLDLDDAAKQALREMIKLLGELAQLPPADAYTLCSLACDLRVTQLVDGNKGIHAMLDKRFVPGA
jgi:acetamidase/formamidase